MSGFMIWHKIVLSKVAADSGGLGAAVASAFGFGLPLTISNNVYSLGLVLDADATLTMAEGAVADRFSVIVYDLPAKDARLLKAAYDGGALAISVSLGYFDNPGALFGDHPVMRGRVTNVATSVGDDGRTRVEITGQEETGWVLLNTPAAGNLRGHGQLDDVARQLLESASAKRSGGITLAAGGTLGAAARDYTVRAGSVLAALSQLTELADVPLVVSDGTVALGAAVGRAAAPVEFDAAENIVQLAEQQADSSTPSAAAGGSGDGDRRVSGGLTVTVLGHPGLRVGQLVKVTNLADPVPSSSMRISALIHRYSTRTGYVCEATLVAAAPGRRSPSASPAARVVDQWNRATQAARQNNPAVDVGEVTAYSAGSQTGADTAHRVSLHYAQVPARTVTTPSVNSPVSTDDDLLNKPVAAAFAFDKVGLVTPIYPGMRAVLVHNRSLTNDAIVAGWLWPSDPASTPPPNQPGDYWLALPTGLGSDGKPQGKGVNDLTDARGARVVQTRALHILVGESKLASVGTRPTVPADDTITIEHSSGTTITIAADGALSITTNHKAITLGNGSVSLKLDGTSVAVS